MNYLAKDDTGLAADPRCVHAFVSLFTVAIEKQSLFRHIIGRFCNDNRPPDGVIVSTSPVLELQYSEKMTSDGKSTHGFLARYRLTDLHLVALDDGNTTEGTDVM